jgi:hypothetical protein
MSGGGTTIRQGGTSRAIAAPARPRLTSARYSPPSVSPLSLFALRLTAEVYICQVCTVCPQLCCLPSTVRPETNEAYICQRYIERPLTVGGRKFDMRIYALVTSYSPLVPYTSIYLSVRPRLCLPSTLFALLNCLPCSLNYCLPCSLT